MRPCRTVAFIFEDTESASKAVLRDPFSFSMSPKRDQGAKRKGLAVFFGEADQCRMMAMGEAGQPTLKRHRNISNA